MNLYIASLDNSPVDIAEVTLANLGGHVREVEIGVANLIQVYVLAEVGVGGVRCTQTESLFVGEYAVSALTCAGTGEDVHLEGASCLVLYVSLLGYFSRYTFRYTSRRET